MPKFFAARGMMKSPVLFQDQPVVELTGEVDRVLIAPGHGARILRWERHGREIVTWPAAADWSRILKVRGGNPVLFPFIARHFVDGKKDLWRDAAGVVRPMPQHGFARDAAFAVVEDGADNSLRMRLTDSDETRPLYPFSFQFDVVVTLQPQSRLEIRFETTNRGEQPLPYDAGHHFYLAIPHRERAQWTLHLPCVSWGRQEPDGSIRHEEATRDLFQLGDPMLVDRFQIQPLGAKATLLHSRTQQRLVFELKSPGSAPWYAVTTWTEFPESDFYCVEPWLGLPNAIHHGEGLRWVAPGQTETAICVLDAAAW
jgi:galactose mutarotase-like enzyme